MPGVSLRKVSIASVIDANVRPSPFTCSDQPRATIAQSASYLAIVTFMRPPPEATQ